MFPQQLSMDTESKLILSYFTASLKMYSKISLQTFKLLTFQINGIRLGKNWFYVDIPILDIIFCWNRTSVAICPSTWIVSFSTEFAAPSSNRICALWQEGAKMMLEVICFTFLIMLTNLLICFPAFCNLLFMEWMKLIIAMLPGTSVSSNLKKKVRFKKKKR